MKALENNNFGMEDENIRTNWIFSKDFKDDRHNPKKKNWN